MLASSSAVAMQLFPVQMPKISVPFFDPPFIIARSANAVLSNCRNIICFCYHLNELQKI